MEQKKQKTGISTEGVEAKPQRVVRRIMGKIQEAIEKGVIDEFNGLQDILATEKAESQKQIAAEWRKIEEQRAQLDEERQAWEAEKAMVEKACIGSNDLITLNFGGENLKTVKRSLLTQIEGSFLSALFSGRHEDRLDKDEDGHVFFDYSPHVMGPLIEHLRVMRDAGPGQVPELPSIPKEWRSQWFSMATFFGLGEIVNPATSFFKGVRKDVPISELKGWCMFFCRPWSHRTTPADFTIPEGFAGNALIIASRQRDSDLLEIAAMGLVDVITKETTSINSASSHNGAFWYNVQGKSFGFAPSSSVNLNYADTSHPSCESRLSWHRYTGVPGGGYRSKTTQTGDNANLQKVILCGTVNTELFT